MNAAEEQAIEIAMSAAMAAAEKIPIARLGTYVQELVDLLTRRTTEASEVATARAVSDAAIDAFEEQSVTKK
jgi:hypothetical protein